MDDLSPISNASLEAAAERLAAAWKRVRKRAPRDVSRAARALLAEVFALVQRDEAEVDNRLELARRLEVLDAQLRGREAFVPQFYGGGKLAIVEAYDPIKIRGTVRHRRVAAHFERYDGPARRAHIRLNYFLERAGQPFKPVKALKPWEQPYADMQEFHELIWGRINNEQAVPPKPGQGGG